MTHTEAVQMFAVVSEKVGFGPMTLTYAQVFASRMNAYEQAKSEQIGSAPIQYRVITLWIQQVTNDVVSEKIARMN